MPLFGRIDLASYKDIAAICPQSEQGLLWGLGSSLGSCSRGPAAKASKSFGAVRSASSMSNPSSTGGSGSGIPVAGA
jgi:hypothetical protein